MGFKSFRSKVIARIILLLAIWTFTVYNGIFRHELYSTLVFTGISIIAIAELLIFIARIHREVDGMVRSILVNDFSLKFPASGKNSQDEIRTWCNLLIDRFRLLNNEKEKHAELLKQLLERIPIGVMCFINMNSCALANQAAKRFLGMESILDFGHLERSHQSIARLITGMHNTESRFVKLIRDNGVLEISLAKTEYIIAGEIYTLLTLENISSELEKKETESWQHLMRVLNHEIVNSITPIVSLSSTLMMEMGAETNSFTREDIHDGISAISKRSEGLLRFAEGYRTFTGITRAKATDFDIVHRIKQIILLLQSASPEVQITCITNECLNVFADEAQTEQVLLNLMKNAIEADCSAAQKNIRIAVIVDDQKVHVTVEDNGCGMNDETLAKIFVPYFTTKEKGQGVGLSLCRQLVLANGGRLFVSSKPGQGTTAHLMLPEKVKDLHLISN